MSSAESRPPSPPTAPPDPSAEWVVAGTVIGLHGVRGEVKVVPETERPGRLGELRSVTLKLSAGRYVTLRVIGYRRYEGKGVDLLRFEGYEDRTAAGALKGAELLVPRGESPPLPEDEYYEWQIVGLPVVTTDGRELGPLEEVLRTGANDVYVTATCLLPATADVIRSIDLPAGRIVVEPPPGLLDDGEE